MVIGATLVRFAKTLHGFIILDKLLLGILYRRHSWLKDSLDLFESIGFDSVQIWNPVMF